MYKLVYGVYDTSKREFKRSLLVAKREYANNIFESAQRLRESSETKLGWGDLKSNEVILIAVYHDDEMIKNWLY